MSSHSTHSTTSSGGDDCNSSTDSINVCVPLFVSTSPVNQVAELDLSSEMMDLTAFLGSNTPPNNELQQVLKPHQNHHHHQVLVNKDPYSTIVTKMSNNQETIATKPGNSLLRSALTGKTSYLMTKQQKLQQNQLPTFRPGSESSKIGEQKVEEILLLAKKRTLENSLPTSSIFTSSGDKLVINTANLLNTAASQLNLAPPSLSTLVPVRTTASIQQNSGGDNNNNIKTIPPPPASVISLVVDVGNNNSSTSTNLNLTPASILADSDLDTIPINIPNSSIGGGVTKKRILKRQKSSSSSSSSPGAAASGHSALIQTFSTSSPGSSLSTSSSSTNSQENEPRKEARLLHYCPICNKGFKDRYSVNVHVRTHTGEKPFSCALCGKCFRQKAHLAKHHQTHAAKQSVLTQQPQQPQTSSKTIVEKMPTTNSASAPTINEEKIVFPLSPVSLELSS